jgi:transcriptional regulator with XRE-family HTH domain
MRWYQRAEALRKKIRPKLTYEKLAEIFGRSQSTMHAWFNGHRNPSFEEVTKIAQLLGVQVQALVDGDEYWIRDDQERAWVAYWRQLEEQDRQVLAKTLGIAKADEVKLLPLPPGTDKPD